MMRPADFSMSFVAAGGASGPVLRAAGAAVCLPVASLAQAVRGVPGRLRLFFGISEGARMAGKVSFRSDDDWLLQVLRLVAAHGPTRAAVLLGMARPYVSVLRQRVMADDLAASAGEDPAAIRAAYGVM